MAVASVSYKNKVVIFHKYKYIIVFFLLSISLIVFRFWLRFDLPMAKTGQEIVFSVAKGQGLFVISQNLEQQGLVKHGLYFEAAVLLKGGSRKLQAGDYKLSQAMSPLKIADKIIKGEVATETIVIPEGWNIKEIDSYLKSKKVAGADEFLEIVGQDFSGQFWFLADKPKSASLEGYLFPDSYEIKIGDDSRVLVEKMLANFSRKITPEMQNEIKKQNKTLFKIITMASLLEKEAKTIEDKKVISGILWKRLKIGMRLQVDATVVYALGDKPRRLTYDDLKIDSPYNTYKYAGLPPGPIANPGLESIIATIYPIESDYWYYLSTPEGEILFSRTLEEHNAKKAQYLK